MYRCFSWNTKHLSTRNIAKIYIINMLLIKESPIIIKNQIFPQSRTWFQNEVKSCVNSVRSILATQLLNAY